MLSTAFHAAPSDARTVSVVGVVRVNSNATRPSRAISPPLRVLHSGEPTVRLVAPSLGGAARGKARGGPEGAHAARPIPGASSVGSSLASTRARPRRRDEPDCEEPDAEKRSRASQWPPGQLGSGWS